MHPSKVLSLRRKRIQAIALSQRMRSVRVFGLALPGDDAAGRDPDLLAEPALQTIVMDIGGIRCELKQLPGIGVDVLTNPKLPASFRLQILREAVPA